MTKDIYIYDIEVLKEDWLFVARKPNEKDYVVIHNNNSELKKFLNGKKLLLGGFNNKHYDDGIIHAMYYGADNHIVKKMNDFIIVERGLWWDFPFVNYKKKVFDSFDLRDDLPINLSLKAIEGNMGRAIVESSIPFDIDRKLTKAELEELIKYCKVDVDNTIELYFKRESYLESKKSVARIKGLDEYEAMSLTNAKLTAKFLDAKKVKRDDEFDYPIPETLDIGQYSTVLEFFKDPLAYTLAELAKKHESATNERTRKSLSRKVDALLDQGDIYDCKLEMKIAGVPHVYAWGGLHGAIPKYFDAADEDHNIVTIDVASYYPSMMLEYDFISRNIPSKQGYADIYHRRLKAKGDGDSQTSDALKLVLNTCYGAMKNQYNDLYDPRNANAICVGGQLLLTDLIDKLQQVPQFKLIQSNTDGVIIKYPRKHEAQVFEIVGEWETRTRLKMEYTDIHAIAQKDVNNYVIKSGEVYLVQNGSKVLQKQDKGYIKTKGGYVSLYGGGDFKNNNMVVLHDALVGYFMNGVPIEDTIAKETDVSKFQIIAKTGSTYKGTYHEVAGAKVDVQNVNRVYATTNTKYGTLKKLKSNGREDKIAGLPDHAIIDNENGIALKDIDRKFYIEMAQSRIVDYVGKRNAEKQLKLYTEEKAVMTTKKAAAKEEVKVLSLYEKINEIRTEFHEAGVKKTGINRYAEYKYFTLEDIIPKIRELNRKYNVTSLFDFQPERATLTIIDNDAVSIAKTAPFDIELNMLSVTFTSPMATQAMPKGGTEVQNLGAVQTYLRRYLYMLYLDLVEEDEVEETTDKPDKDNATAAAKKEAGKKTVTAAKTTKSNRPATPKEREEAKSDIIDKEGEASETQIKSIKNGLKKLRDKDDTNEAYIKKVVLKMREGITKKQAENLLLDIAEKVKA